eukprot:3214660-Amphidinium_carterae.1
MGGPSPSAPCNTRWMSTILRIMGAKRKRACFLQLLLWLMGSQLHSLIHSSFKGSINACTHLERQPVISLLLFFCVTSPSPCPHSTIAVQLLPRFCSNHHP